MSNSSLRRFHPLPWLLVLIGFAAAASVLAARYRDESGNRSVELAIDFVQIRQLGGALNVRPAESLARLRQAGVTGAILTEETPADLWSEGELLQSERWIAGKNGRRTRVTVVETADPALF